MFDAILYFAAGLISLLLLCLSNSSRRTASENIPHDSFVLEPEGIRKITGMHDYLVPAPSGTAEDEALLYYDMACFDSKYGHFTKARERLRKACQISPKFRDIAVRDPELEPLWRETHAGV